MTAAITFAQSPPETKLSVVAPLCPKLVPIAPPVSVVKKPFPHPPPEAVVESPAKKNAGGLACFLTVEMGDAVARAARPIWHKRENCIFGKRKECVRI